MRQKLRMTVPPRPLNPNELHGQDMDSLDTLEARSNKLVELLNKKFNDPIDPIQIERTTRRRIVADKEELYKQFGVLPPSQKK